MFNLVCPQPRARSNSSYPQNFSQIYFGVVVVAALALVTTGCSTMAASGSPSIASEPIAMSANLPPATVGSAYNAVISVSGGVAPYHFSTRAGEVPPGLILNASTGTISGTPKLMGKFSFTISVTDKESVAEGAKSFLVSVQHAATPSLPVSVEISPTSVTIPSGTRHQFLALVSNASTPAVSWSASGGTISSAGLFTAPKVNTSTTFHLTATSTADPTKTASAIVNVELAQNPTTTAALSLTSTSLPEATEGSPYTTTLQASGGKTPYSWKLQTGSLPSGFSMDATKGTISGLTSQSGSFDLTAAVTDAAGQTATRKLALAVSLSSSGNFDGPAELPRVYISSALADTPAPGAIQSVSTAASLQSALNSAKCGDTISLQAGNTFTGTFVFPSKPCDDNHWIIVRTSAPNSSLPPEGTRLTPCYAGVASLPARPAFSCPATKNVLAKLAYDQVGSGPIVLASGANHYRFIGLEITRTQPKAVVYNLIINAKNGTSDHIILDRVWAHGTAQDETTRGIILSANTYVAIVDSYFSDFHCVAISGACGDSQAIGGGLGDSAMGPYKITNNFLEAAGENVIFGGGPATFVPADIEIRGNHMFKPLTWMKGSPNFVGGRDGHPFIVKNLFELKNGQRVLLEGNIMDGSWGGFSQVGFAILLTPKNQAGASGTSVCPSCLVTDVTIRYNLIRHMAAGLQIGNGVSSTGGAPRDGQRYSVHDSVFEDLDGATYNGPGLLAQVTTGAGAPLLQNVKIDHITAVSLRSILALANPKSYAKMPNFTFTNNITNAGTFSFIVAQGGAQDCAYQVANINMLNACLSDYQFSHNAIIAPPKNAPVSQWPAGNFFPASEAGVHFENAAGSLSANYGLQSSSPYKNAGTDGKDLGADIAALQAAIASAE
jgi:hypothetical protein